MSQFDFDEAVITNWASIRDSFMSAVGGSASGSTTPCKVSVAFVDELNNEAIKYQEYLAENPSMKFKIEKKTFILIMTLLENRSRGKMTVKEVLAAFKEQDAHMYSYWLTAIVDCSKRPATEHLTDESILANQNSANVSGDVNKPLAGTSNVSDRHDNASDAIFVKVDSTMSKPMIENDKLESEAPLMTDWDSMKAALLSVIADADPSNEGQDSVNGLGNSSKPGSSNRRQFSKGALAFVTELGHLARQFKESAPLMDDLSDDQFEMRRKSFLLIHSLLHRGLRGLLSAQEVSAALKDQDAQLYGVWIETLKKNHLIDVSKLPVVEYLVDEPEQANCDATKVAPSTRNSVLRRKSVFVKTNKKISTLTFQKVDSNKFKKVVDMKPVSCRALAMHPPTRNNINENSHKKILKYVQAQQKEQKENDENVSFEDNKIQLDSEEEVESDEDMDY